MKQTLLIIEESEPICYLLETNLKKSFDIEGCSDTYRALNLLSRNHIDLIIIGTASANSIELQFAKMLRSGSFYANIPIIALVGKDTDEQTLILLEEMGISAVFRKPFDPVNLQKTISELLSHRTGIKKTKGVLRPVEDMSSMKVNPAV